jgi:signal transduction histidine kinase
MDRVLPISDFQADIDSIAGMAAMPTILDVVCRTTGMGFAAVARVTADRWIACSVRDGIAFGLQPGGELQVQTTICHEVRQHCEPVIINNVAEDPVYCGHPTPAMYGFQSYISIPIVLPNGAFFGTLCAIDPKPRMLATPEIIGAFKLFAELIAFHLDAHLRVAASEATLARERELSDLREQFIAVLGHDLRNPLAAVSAGLHLVARSPERSTDIVRQMEQSLSRMSGLIDDVMDFARGRLGSGLTLKLDADEPLEPTLVQVVQELQSTHPDRRVDLVVALDEPVRCDRARIAQLLSNLLANALTYGGSSQPVSVSASAERGSLILSVANGGDPIPPEAMQRLFQPFFRGEVRRSGEGLGLGLYIAAEIARAHGGQLSVTSTPAETCFTLRMPAGA